MLDFHWRIERVGACTLGFAQALAFQRNIRADAQHAADARRYGGLFNLSASPLHVHHEASASHEALHFAVTPCRGQSREQVNGSVVALQQHLRHARGVAEVAVNLERRVRVEQVGIRPAVGVLLLLLVAGQQLQHVAYYLIGVVAVKHTRPEVHLPADAPARSLVSALQQRVLCGLEQRRVLVRRNLVAGVKSVQVGYVAVLVAWVVNVLKPLLQLVVAAHLHGRQPVEHAAQACLVSLVNAERPCSQQRAVERVEGYLVVHGAACGHHCARSFRPLFGRHRRTAYHPAVLWMLGEERQEEVGRAL